MNRLHADYQIISYPKFRQWTAIAYRSVRQKPMIHGLFAVDVTNARTLLREHKSRTGEALSFTAFLIACLAKAVDEHKAVHAIRYGRGRLAVFDDVDVWTPIERDIAGVKAPLPHIVKAANHKSFREIHDEIRAAQSADVSQVARWPRVVPAALFRASIWLFWQMGRVRPRYQKQTVGTVGLTAVGMFGEGAGWGVPPPNPTPLMLTVGGIGEKQVTVDGCAATREYLCLTISVDHEIVDGAPATRFTRRLKELIESSYGLDGLAVVFEQAAVDSSSPQKAAATRT